MLSGLLLRIVHLGWGLPQLYEEAFPFTIAWRFWNWDGPGLSFDPHFYNYPALTFYLQYFVQALHFVLGVVSSQYASLAAYRAAFELNPTTFILLARLVTVFFDLGIIFIVYLFGKRLRSETVGIVASLLLVMNPLHLRFAQMVNVVFSA